MIDYYTRIAPALLPHLRDRAADAQALSQRRRRAVLLREAVPHAPARLGAHRADPIRHDGRTIDFCVVDDLPTLVWLANLADLELHPSLSRADDLDARRRSSPSTSTRGRRRRSSSARRSRCELREAFDDLGLRRFPKTSGSKGMQVYVPLNAPTDLRRRPSLRAGGRRAARAPRTRELVVSEMTKAAARRQGAHRLEPERRAQDDGLRVLAARARSARRSRRPLRWEEVEACASRGDPDGARLRRPPRCSPGWPSTGTCSPPWRRSSRSCRRSSSRMGGGEEGRGRWRGRIGPEQADRGDRALELPRDPRVDFRYADVDHDHEGAAVADRLQQPPVDLAGALDPARRSKKGGGREARVVQRGAQLLLSRRGARRVGRGEREGGRGGGRVCEEKGWQGRARTGPEPRRPRRRRSLSGDWRGE